MKSGRGDSNPWPQRPERCALTRLRYAPVSRVNYNEKWVKIKAQKKIRQERIQKRDEDLYVKFNNVPLFSLFLTMNIQNDSAEPVTRRKLE